MNNEDFEEMAKQFLRAPGDKRDQAENLADVLRRAYLAGCRDARQRMRSDIMRAETIERTLRGE